MHLKQLKPVMSKPTTLIFDRHLSHFHAYYNINSRMSCCFQVERIVLPRQFLFDSIRLYAKFQSTAVDLLALRFDLSQATTERNIPLNVQLRIPFTRSKFSLVMQVRIINMRVPPCEVTVDLAIKDCNQF